MSGAEILVNKCLNIQKGEKVVIVTDKDTMPVADSLSEQVKKSGALPELYVIKEHERPVKELPDDLKQVLKGASACMTPFRAIPLEGSFRFSLVKMMNSIGARVAHMPGITEKILNNPELDNVDFGLLDRYADTLYSALDGAEKIRITQKNGTDITFSIKGRRVTAEGCLIPKGETYNFPSGEVFVAPIENTAEGTFVCNVSCGDAGYVDAPLSLRFSGGRLVGMSGGGSTRAVIEKDIAEAAGKKDTLCEFGIGINPFFTPVGNALTDEKILGTCHIALGDNTGLGGINKSSVHIDFIMDSPTIIIDGKTTVLREGKLDV